MMGNDEIMWFPCVLLITQTSHYKGLASTSKSCHTWLSTPMSFNNEKERGVPMPFDNEKARGAPMPFDNERARDGVWAPCDLIIFYKE